MTRPLVLRRTPEAALIQRLVDIFQPKDQTAETILRRVLWRAIQGKLEFRPHLVARNGEIVGAVPGGMDRLLMQLHLAHKKVSRDATRNNAAATSKAASAPD
jgi:hypothetical protein